uniref:Uncharacterized protein n=1 Tax=Romanomermis culicivorax TaxID=13658 RepID=A0A915HLQ0_ROMCU
MKKVTRKKNQDRGSSKEEKKNNVKKNKRKRNRRTEKEKDEEVKAKNQDLKVLIWMIDCQTSWFIAFQIIPKLVDTQAIVGGQWSNF